MCINAASIATAAKRGEGRREFWGRERFTSKLLKAAGHMLQWSAAGIASCLGAFSSSHLFHTQAGGRMNTSYYGFKQSVAPDMATSKGLECEHCVKVNFPNEPPHSSKQCIKTTYPLTSLQPLFLLSFPTLLLAGTAQLRRRCVVETRYTKGRNWLLTIM